MSIIDPGNPISDTAAEGAQNVKRALKQCTNMMDQYCKRVCNIITTHTRSSIDTELGADAAVLVTLYGDIKTVLESAAVGKTIADLPS